jgi:hypothetical protein
VIYILYFIFFKPSIIVAGQYLNQHPDITPGVKLYSSSVSMGWFEDVGPEKLGFRVCRVELFWSNLLHVTRSRG